MNNIFTGVVITSASGPNTVTVARESYGGANCGDMGQMLQGTVISSIMSTFLGFKESSLPQPGSRVLCVDESTDNCFILGVIPAHSVNPDAFPARAMLGAGNSLADGANRVGNSNTARIFDNRKPTDIVDGECAVSNEFGVLLGLYQQLATLKGSELSQVQCFLLDDLVRIISHNFQHYTALGEYNIYHDGQHIMAEFGATHKPAESYGSPAVNSDTPDSPTFEETGSTTVDDKKDFYDISGDERIKAIERFKMFLGGVGDFLHLFVVRPDPQELRILDPDKTPETPDTGLSHLHLGTDGGIHFRSVKEVFIEKTNWIRVPLRKAAPDDPNGDDAATLSYEHKNKFEFKDEYSYKNNPFMYALQLRDYVAYVNEKLGYQNFKTHEKDFYVNDDIDRENSLKEIGPVDAETDLNQQQYDLRTAGIYLMPNGGITIRDAWNSAIVMEGGNVYIQPAKDLVTQPLRNSITKAGGHINMACKGLIDLSSSNEGLRLKAEKAMYLYSNASGVVLEANGETDSPGTGQDGKALEDIGGIVLKSKLSIYSYAEDDVVIYAKKRALLQSLQNTDIVVDGNFTLYGKQGAELLADSLLMHGARIATLVSDQTVILAGATTTAIGQKDQNLAIGYDTKSEFVDILKGALEVSELTSQLDKIREAKGKILSETIFTDSDTFDLLKFQFPSSAQYGNLDPNTDAIPATMAQQDDLLTNMYSLQLWKEKPINDSLPYPGTDLFDNFYLSAEKPANLEKNKLGKDYSNKADSSSTPCNITLDSLNTYKVQTT